MTVRILNRALEEAIRRAYALGRVDQSIGVAATELRRMVEAEPDITPAQILRRHGARPSPWSNVPDWDHALWALADVWCEIYRGLQGRQERLPPASPYSVLNTIRSAYEAGQKAGEQNVMERVLSVFGTDESAREALLAER